MLPIFWTFQFMTSCIGSSYHSPWYNLSSIDSKESHDSSSICAKPATPSTVKLRRMGLSNDAVKGEMFLVPMQPDKHRSCWDVDLVRATGDRRPLCPFCQANFGVGSFSAIASQEQRFARIRLLQDVKLMLDCLTCFLYKSHSICSSLLFIFEG